MTPDLADLILHEINYRKTEGKCRDCVFVQPPVVTPGQYRCGIAIKLGTFVVDQDGTCDKWEERK